MMTRRKSSVPFVHDNEGFENRESDLSNSIGRKKSIGRDERKTGSIDSGLANDIARKTNGELKMESGAEVSI
jgi:hypothetical protein